MSNITKIVSEKASLIWSIADKLVGVYKPHEYGDVILHLTVLKRFDSVLSDTKDKVLEMSKKYPETFAKRDFILKETAGQKFYNTSKYDFKKLLDDPDNIEENFYNYINGYSDEVKDIIKNFDLNKQIEKMAGNGILYQVIDTFNSENANLHPNYVSNIEMGYIFEEIIRRFNELSNEEAGQHYTPREVIELMVNLIFEDEEDLADSFKKLKSRDGKFGVLGNHDHWMGSSIIRDIFKQSDIIDLSNDVHTLERDGEFLNICGVDSCTVCADNLDRVIAKMPKGIPSILLAHEPDFAKESSQTNFFDLQISGHSHGGQFIIPKVETTPFRGPNSTKYPVGLYKVRDMIQYTSKGLGTNSFRIRINCKPEVTIITLKTGKKQKIEIEWALKIN